MNFISEIQDRLQRPWSWPFFGYLLIVMVLGAIGVFFTWNDIASNNYKESYKVAESLATFFIAIIAISFIDLNISPNLQNRLAFFIFSFIFYSIAVALLWWTFKCKSDVSFLPASIGTAVSIIVWIIANADNDKLNEQAFIDNLRGKDKGHGQNW